MAKTPSTLVGLELDPGGVHVAAVTTKGGLHVTEAVTAPLAGDVLRDGEVADVDALAAALRDIWRDRKDLGKRVRIGIANQKVAVRVLELPPISDPKELAQAVRFQAQDEIPMPVDAAVIDFQALDVIDTDNGPRQQVVVVAARRDMIDRVLQAVRDAGLRPEAIDLSAFAMVRALHHSAIADGADPSDTVMYLAIGGLTNLAVAQGTTCRFTRVVSTGVEAIAVELAERRRLSLEHARGWLDHVGLEVPSDTVEGDPEIVADARMCLDEGVRRIAAEVRNSVDFHHAQGSGAPVARVVLAGPAAGIPGFAEMLSAELGLPVVVGRIEGVQPEMQARIAVAAGLAIPEEVAA